MLRSARLMAWLSGLAVTASHALAMANPICGPAATLLGRDELVGEVVLELVSRGIDVKPPATCPSVGVHLARKDGQIVVELTDPAGRTVTRSVSRVGEAVTVIESWARPDMNADLLAGFDAPTSPKTPSASPASDLATPAESKPSVDTRPAPPSSSTAVARHPLDVQRDQRSRLTISLVGDIAIDRRASWVGAMVTACTPVWRVCVGGTGHLRTSATATQPTDTTLLASIDLPLRVRRLTLIPGLGIGAGRDSSDMSDGMGSGMQDQADSGWSLRGEARMIASYPLTRRVFLDVAVGLVAAPATGGDEQNQNQNGESSTTGPAMLFQLGAGLRLGAP